MKIIAPLMTMAVAVQAFVPQQQARTATQLEMGLFDFLQPKPSTPKPKPGQVDISVFGGRGARITIREDEGMFFACENHSSLAGQYRDVVESCAPRKVRSPAFFKPCSQPFLLFELASFPDFHCKDNV